ncbi:MAG: hypothetical protein ACTSXP_11700 [Promethearchaeota archaeon]
MTRIKNFLTYYFWFINIARGEAALVHFFGFAMPRYKDALHGFKLNA